MSFVLFLVFSFCFLFCFVRIEIEDGTERHRAASNKVLGGACGRSMTRAKSYAIATISARGDSAEHDAAGHRVGQAQAAAVVGRDELEHRHRGVTKASTTKGQKMYGVPSSSLA